MTQDHTTETPVCYRHPDRHTQLRCSRCGRPICVSCSIDATVGQRCPDCIRSEGTQKVIPTGARRSRTAGIPGTMTFIVLAVGFFLLTNLGGLRETLFENLAQANFLIAEGEWWRVVTPVLLHGTFYHILFNMWALWVLGPQIERGVGSLAFVSVYLASAAVGGAFVYVLGDPRTVAVGASGAIFGLFGIWANWAVRRRHTIHGRMLLRQIGFLLLLNAALPLLIRNIAWEAHLGGLIAGFLIGELWSRVRRPDAELARVAIGAAIGAMAIITVLVL